MTTASPLKPCVSRTVKRTLKVLVVDEELPYPLLSGKRIRTFNLLKHLSNDHRIAFLCHRNSDPEELNLASAAFKDLGIRVEFLQRSLPPQTLLMPKTRLVGELVRNLVSPYPYFVQKQLSSELFSKVASISRREDVDLVHFEWTPYAAAMGKQIRKPWVIDAHNVESLIWQRYSEVETNWFKSRFIQGQWKRTVNFERKMFQGASHTVFVSQSDQAIARTQFGCRTSSVVDNGVDTAGYEFSARTYEVAPTFLFLGSLDWRPNLDGVYFLLDKVWPFIRSRYPNAHLEIVGRNPCQSLAKRILAEPNCTLHASVPDVRPFLAVAAAMIVPLRIGGGSRLKVLEAAASGLPVISTGVGIEGLELEADTHYVLADTAEQMISAVSRICNRENSAQLVRMTKSARQLIDDRYDWSSLADKLASVWQTQVAQWDFVTI